MRIRRFFVRVHRWAGLASALFLAVAGLTGTPLAFYNELDELLNPALYEDRSSSAETSLLPNQQLIDRIEKEWPGTRVRYINLRTEPGRQSRGLPR
jgi:uncharacterized iron-regulated membrane protein